MDKAVRPAAPEAAAEPVKDKELKDLIQRMSKNLDQEKTLLRATPASAPQPAPAPGDGYWDKLHETLKKPEAGPQQDEIKRLEQEILLKKSALQQTPAPSQPAAPAAATAAEEAGLITPKAPAPAPTHRDDDEFRNQNYVSPENRLIFGKQEYYSTLHKRITPKTKEENLTKLQSVVEEKEVRYSEEEEKKLLKQRIIRKYKVDLVSMNWGRVIIIAVLFLTALGGSLYFLLPRSDRPTIHEETLTTGQSIPQLEQQIAIEIVAKEYEVANINYFDSNIAPWKQMGDDSIVRLTVNYDKHEIMLPREDALQLVLGQENFQNIPTAVLELTQSRYNLLVFKNNGNLRVGIALSYDTAKEAELREAMLSWEKSPTISGRIYNVMKPLFTASGFSEPANSYFQPATYNGVELKYVNLPDSDTSMDYILHNGYLVFTTSKDTTFEMIDLIR